MMILIGILTVAAITDLRRYKIPNGCIGAGMLAGLGLALWQDGAVAVFLALIQMAVVFALFYPLYLMRGLGAGDVKLLMLLGCYLDRTQLEACIALTMALAAVVAVIKLAALPEARANLRQLGGCTRKLLKTGAWDGFCPTVTGAGVVRLAPGVLISVLALMGGGVL